MARPIFLSVLVIFLVPDFSLQQNIENSIRKLNETSSSAIEPSKPRTLYDYQTRVVAYKDLSESKCVLEILNGHESQISKWISNGSKDSISKNFLISNQLLSKRQIWQLAGQRVTEFCKGFPTYLVNGIVTENQNGDGVNVNENIINNRRKRQTRHYFQGRVRGQTQSQYLNFGKVDQPGKAEAESTLEGSKAVVSGNNGMGQAQSQTQPLGCDECYGPGYGLGTSEYDQGQSIGFGQGRPTQRFPGKITQQRPALIPGQSPTGPEQFGGGNGHIGDFGSGGRPGQFGGGPGQTGGDFGSGGQPGQLDRGHGEIIRGPGEADRGPGQFGGDSRPIGGRGPGHIGGDFEPQGGRPGQFNGVGGEIAGSPGQIGGGRGETSRGPGQTAQRPEQFGHGNGQTSLGTDHSRGTEFGNGHAGGDRGQIQGGLDQFGGRPGQTGELTDHGLGGNGQFVDSSRTTIPSYGPIDGVTQTVGRPGQPVNGGSGISVEQNGFTGMGPEQSRGKPGQFGAENIDKRPGSTSVGGLPDYGITGTENIRRPGQGGGVNVPIISQQNGRTVGSDSRGKIEQIDQATGPIIDLGDSVKKPTQYGGSFGGNLAGDYQSSLGQAGRFYGKFSGQYEPAGYPYTSYVRPEIPSGPPRYTGQGNAGLQPGLGGISYRPGFDGQTGVQHLPTTGDGTSSKIYLPGYVGTTNYQPEISSQPNYGSQRPFEQPNQSHYVGQPNYNGQIPPQQLGGHGGVGGPYGQGLGTQGGGQKTPDQFQNGFQGGVSGGPGQTVFQPSSTGNGGQAGGGTGVGQPVYTNQYETNRGFKPEVQGGPGYQPVTSNNQYETNRGFKPEVQGGPGYQPVIGINGNQGAPDSRQPFRQPDYTGQNGVGPHQVQGGYNGQQGTGTVAGKPNIYGTNLVPDGQGGYVNQLGVGKQDQYGITSPDQYGGGTDGPPSQYTDQRYPSTTGQGSGSQFTDGTQNFDDSDSQVQTSVQQTENGTHAEAQAQGTYNGGTAQSQVSGVYSGSGSFSASAGSDDGKRGAQTQVSGGDYGAKSSAQGKGGLGQTQSQVILSSETGDTLSSAQSKGSNHGTQTQVQASERGGMADAQANGAGSTSSQAQIGFTPYDENDEDNQTAPFRGGGTAGAQSGSYAGMTQAQIQGKFRFGIKYTGAAQAGSGGTSSGKNQTFKPGPFKPLDLTFYTGQNERSETHSQKQASFLQTNKKIKGSTLSSSEGTTDSIYVDRDHKADTDGDHDVDTDGDQAIDTDGDLDEDSGGDDDEDDGYDENEYGQPEKPATRSIITQTSDNQRQHIILDPLEDLDATVHQSRGDFPADGTILQPGQYIPGSPGYKIPQGFRGTVKSISNGRNTYAIGKNSQAQSVTLSPGSGRIIYKRPVYTVSSNTHFRNGQYGYGSGYTYQPAYQPVQYRFKNGKVLPNFVSVSKSETGSKNLYTGKKTPNIYYTQSSSCGIFTNHCVFNAGKKICFPKVKTNPDGTIMGC